MKRGAFGAGATATDRPKLEISRRNGLTLTIAALAVPMLAPSALATTVWEENMATAKLEIERVSVRSSRPFETVVAALKAAVGEPDMTELANAVRGARSFAELESAVHRGVGSSGLMLFMQLDHGAILRRETGLDRPKIVRFVVGNPLIMKEMVKHVPDAGSYAPVTVLVDERPDGVHLSYDRMASLLAPYGNPDALAVAHELDAKIETLLRNCA
jgi:uncharacterized protein (DUF302 family)